MQKASFALLLVTIVLTPDLALQSGAAAPNSFPSYSSQVLRTALESAFVRLTVDVLLDSPPEQRAPYYHDLLRAGLLESYVGKDAAGHALTEYRLTARGRTFAANHLWVVGYGIVSIPVGRERVTRVGTAHFENARVGWVNFAFRSSLNWQGRSLLAMGPARDWVVAGGFPLCRTTLDRFGRGGTARAEIFAHDGIIVAGAAKSWGRNECAHHRGWSPS